MDVTKLKKEIKETIFPNGEKKIKGQKHQDMLFGLVDEIDRSDGLMRADIVLNQEMAMENRGNINDLRGETAEKFSKVDTSISDINIRETETTKELDNIKNALRDVTSGKDNGQVTGGKVINIPTQATNSVAGYKISGLTATQLVQNGDFSGGGNDWDALSDSFTFKDNKCFFIPHKNALFRHVRQPLSVTAGNKYYIFAEINNTSDNFTYFRVVKEDIEINYPQMILSFENLKGLSKQSVITSYENTGIVNFGVKYQSSIDTVINDNTYIAQIFIINLTQTFGAGNEPTKEWCDEHFPEYFDGTKSVKTPLRLTCGESKLFINSELELKKGDVIKNGVLNGKKLNTSGTLVSKADSKVVVDYAKNSTLLYNKGLKIDDIKKLEVLQKFEKDGSITSLDVAKATYTNKVLIHPELKDSDVCYVEYIYDSGIYGDNTITYGIDKFITNAPLISPDGRKWRKIEVATNDGILTTKLEEIK